MLTIKPTPTIDICVNYTELGKLDVKTLAPSTFIKVFLDTKNSNTLLTNLVVLENKTLAHYQNYMSALEFSTTSMKEVLTLFVKRKVVELYPNDYDKDDPKLHNFISKLSYEGIKYVAEHVDEFAAAFKDNNVSKVLNIPKPSKKHRS